MIVRGHWNDLLSGAYVVGIRWDLSPWDVVLDLNSRKSEQLCTRVWLIFRGVRSLTVPISNLNSPLGFFIKALEDQPPTQCGDLETSDLYGQNRYFLWSNLSNNSTNLREPTESRQHVEVVASGVEILKHSCPLQWNEYQIVNSA